MTGVQPIKDVIEDLVKRNLEIVASTGSIQARADVEIEHFLGYLCWYGVHGGRLLAVGNYP